MSSALVNAMNAIALLAAAHFHAGRTASVADLARSILGLPVAIRMQHSSLCCLIVVTS